MKTSPTLALCALVAALGTGCVSFYPSTRPATLAGGVSGVVAGNYVDPNRRANDLTRYVVAEPPPMPASAPRQRTPASPAREAVWMEGYWAYTGNPASPYEWMSGHWEVPPPGAQVWVPSGWQRTNGSYVYVRGYWR